MAAESKRTVCIVIEARAVHRVTPDGSLVREERPPSSVKIETPVGLPDISINLLKSGLAVLPGKQGSV